MSNRGEGAPPPFGRRRFERDVEVVAIAPSPGDALRDRPPGRSGSLRWAVQSAAAAGLVAVLAVHSLSRLTEPAGPAIRVVDNRGVLSDPETTGSLAAAHSAAARSVRLDPCSVATAVDPRR